jgi:osmoprotectant transport system ATP-binding protein
MTIISFEQVTKIYPNAEKPSVVDVTLEVEQGSFVVLLGPSGCGKTTLLKMVNRLQEPSEGRIRVNGSDIRDIPVNDLRRQIGYVIQQIGLFPHMTVAKNIAVVPELLKWDKDRMDARIDELLGLVNLDPAVFRSRYPAQLSGGQQQRVGLARALAADPKLMLMDEPFGAIDAITRESLQNEMLRLQRKLKKTILFVTHDVDEALKLADKIVILKAGRLVQYAPPCELLSHPANDFVRDLLNSDDRIRQLSMLTAGSVMAPISGQPIAGAPVVEITSDLRQVLSVLLRPAVEGAVVEQEGRAVGWISLDRVRRAGCEQ